jgi:hypothetical protein
LRPLCVCHSVCASTPADSNGSAGLQRDRRACYQVWSGSGGLQRGPQSPCQGEGRGFESRRPLSSRLAIRALVRASFLWSFSLGPGSSELGGAGGRGCLESGCFGAGGRAAGVSGDRGSSPCLSVVDSLRSAVGRCLRPLSVGRRAVVRLVHFSAVACVSQGHKSHLRNLMSGSTGSDGHGQRIFSCRGRSEGRWRRRRPRPRPFGRRIG